ncbi:PREDICTED: uncharacterized protein LOC108555793 [Eufriesea mexicana]|uniref:uncharacterized protein LOC108555793 n=1 Tax=Eufriesea mexicana TaxID=516756 RepID=UPI00083C713D|nr:PREDICTED: uncharacterized protein LOC108555793 [Eufriesea mexicana]
MQVNLQKRENIQTTILALLLTQKGGCTLRELDNDYFQLEGMYIPWKDLGYSSLLSFLRSIPKAVKIENKNNTIIVKGIASDKSIHVSKLVAGQKSVKQLPGRKSYKPNHYFPMTAPPRIHVSADILSKIVSLVNDNPDGVNKDYILHEVRSCMPFVNITMDDIENQLQELSHTIFQRNNKIYPIQTKIEDLDHLKSSNDMSSSEPTMVSNNKQVCKPLIVTIAGDENLGDMLNVDDEENMFEFPSTKTFHSDHTKSITKTKPTFSFIEESISKYQDQMAEHISIPKVQYDNNINQTQVEFDNIRRDEESQVFNKDVKILINERMKFRLEKLIQNHFDGIWCSDLPKKYLEEYKVPLNYVELGFNSVREFASQLPEIFHCIQPYSTGDFILYYAKRELPSNKIKEKCKANNITELYHIYETNDEEALPVTVSLDTCKGLIPDNVMNIGESVGYINVANLIQNIKPYIEVVVVEVFTPSFFWIQLYKKQKIFKKFMDDLHNFYTMEYMKYVIPPVVLEKGLNCACIYNGIWHRGIIKTVKPDFQVTVMFYDYGTLKTYPPEAIYYLHRMFSNLPAQAIPCGLINIRPYQGSKWSRNATHNFAIRTCEIPLIAIIASIDEEDNSMLVSLTDTLEEEDVHINDWLVEQKLAAHGKMEDKVDMNNLLLYVEENLIFRPEQCYEEKTNIFNDNNIPLVSPQSTLHEKCFQSSKPIMFDEQEILLTKKDIQDQILQTDSIPSIFTFSENNTNPFLQDEPPNDQINNNISPQAFMQLWKKNLQLEMQINIILNILHKVINDSVKNVNDNITNDESILNAIKGALLLTENNYREKDTVTNTDSTNVECHPECLTIPATSEQPIITTSYNGDHDSNVGINPFRETIIHNLVKSQSVMDYNTLMPVNDDFDTVNQSLSNHLLTTTENSVKNELILKETNPFKLSLAGKLHIPDSPEKDDTHFNDLLSVQHKNHKSVIASNLIHFEDNDFKTEYTDQNMLNNCKNTLFEHYQHFTPDISNNTSNIKNDSFALNAKSFNNKWNVDNIINTAPKIIISDESMQQAVHKKEMEKHCFSPSEENLMDNSLHFIEELYNQFNQSLFIQDNDFVTSRDVPNCETMNENFTFSPNYNEKDSIHSSPFHTLCSSSINSSSIMKQNEIQCNQTSMTNSDQLNSASIKLWNKTPKNTTRLKNCSTICSVPENNEEKVICNEDQQKNSLQNNTPADTVDFEVNTNNIGTKDTYSKETKFKTVGKVTYIPKCSFLNYQVFFQVVELPEEVMHIFYYQGIGWLLINEVIKVFSELELTLDTVKLEHVLNTNAQIKEIDRAENSIIFIQTNSVSSKATYNIIDGTNQLRLIPLKLILKVLYELKIISQEDISDIYLHEKFICNSTAHVIWLITNAYRHFKYYIENGQ